MIRHRWRVAGRVAAACLASTLPACDSRPTPAASAATKPATVSAPVKEAELTTIKLTSDAEKRLAIKTVAVEQRPVARTRTVGGEIAAPSGAALAITSPTSGVLQAPNGMPVAGAQVARGDLLFRLLPLPTAERDSPVVAQQAIDTATAKQDAAARKTRRAEQLLKDGAGSRRQLEEAQAELAVADAELKAALDRRALASRTGISEAGVRIEAPQAGIIQAVHVRDGQTVPASAPLLDLVQMARVWVRVPVYAGEAREIDPSAPARVLPLNAASDAEGAVAQPIPAPPSANAATAGVDLYYAMSNPGAGAQPFRPGERVEVRLTRRESVAGTVVPRAALLHDAYGGSWVYVAREPQVYARVRVVVSDIVNGLAVLSTGPPAGTRVVTDGAAELFGVEFGVGK